MDTNDWCIICRAIVFVHYTTATLLCIDSRIYGVSRYIRYITRSTYTSIYVRSSYSSNVEVLRFLHMCGSSDTPFISRTYVIRQVRRRYVALTPDTPHVRSHWRIQRGAGGPDPPHTHTHTWNCQIINFCHVEIFRKTPSGNLDPPEKIFWIRACAAIKMPRNHGVFTAYISIYFVCLAYV